MDAMQLFFSEWAEALEEDAREKRYACEGCASAEAKTGAISYLRIEQAETEQDSLLVFDLKWLCPVCLKSQKSELDSRSVLYHLQGGGFSVLENSD